MTSETYPSGRIVNTCMDGANRAFQVSISQCGDASFAYASNVKYAVHGAPTQIVMGNNLWHNPVYNSRLQMSSFQDLLNNNANVTLWSGNLNWGSSNNNGNLAGATYYAGGPGYPQLLTFNQVFTYDGLNRLVSASETGGWSRTFAYDAYGNMTPSGTPAPPTISFNSNNQIVGQPYDQAGNLLAANGNTLGYDFEGRIISEKDGQNQAVETYVFDADGRRVEKYGPSGTARIVYAYDALGRMAAEYSTVAEAPSCVTCYLSTDHLGTTRLITDQNGLVVARHDFMPFGEELLGNTYGRDSHWGLGNDSINQKFTGKERDSESGLDYFGARYYGSALGRFTSPDNGVDQTAEDPQSWNLYGYVRNNPLQNIDRDGRRCTHAKGPNGEDIIEDADGKGCAELHDNTVRAFDNAGIAMLAALGENLNEVSAWTNVARHGLEGAMFAEGLKDLAVGGLNLAEWLKGARDARKLANLGGLLREALKGKGNFGIREGSAQDAEELGKAWVGEGATTASDGKTLVSADKLRQYRPPSFKPNLGKTQANFEARWEPGGQWQTNGHLDVK